MGIKCRFLSRIWCSNVLVRPSCDFCSSYLGWQRSSCKASKMKLQPTPGGGGEGNGVKGGISSRSTFRFRLCPIPSRCHCGHGATMLRDHPTHNDCVCRRASPPRTHWKVFRCASSMLSRRSSIRLNQSLARIMARRAGSVIVDSSPLDASNSRFSLLGSLTASRSSSAIARLCLWISTAGTSSLSFATRCDRSFTSRSNLSLSFTAHRALVRIARVSSSFSPRRVMVLNLCMKSSARHCPILPWLLDSARKL